MPKEGFKSITLSEVVYDKFHGIYQDNKETLAMRGINSFAGYITYMLEEMMEKDKTFAKYAPKIECVDVDSDRVILKDNIKNRTRVIEVVIQRGELFCEFCEESDCIHVGYVFSIPEVYKALNARGIKNPR